ncbi:hypothetical protein P2318_26640 [Myxococcaceae bacterium GXIMD 01537]
MNARLLTAFLCLATLSGCIIHEYDDDDCCTPPPPVGRSGDVSFLWTFAGMRCDDVRDVKGVNIRIPGESLANSGRYDCTTGTIDGITLHDFAPGTYSFEIDGVSYSNDVLYRGGGSFTINGDARVNVDLTPRGSPPSYAYLSWFFPNGANCSQANVKTVRVTLDGQLSENFNCALGNTTTSTVKTPYLEPGTHSIELIAYDAYGTRTHSFKGSVTTQSGRPSSAEYTLRAETGRVLVGWTLSRDGGVTSLTCQQAGVQEVSIDFQYQDGSNRWVFNGNGDNGPCSTQPASYDLAPGRYLVSIIAKDSSNALYRSANGLYVDVAAAQETQVPAILNRGSN